MLAGVREGVVSVICDGKILAAIQQRYGIAPEEANRQIDEWTSKLSFR
jgi:hypothetical protein